MDIKKISEKEEVPFSVDEITNGAESTSESTRAKQMTAEQKTKLQYSWRITIACLVGVVALVITEILINVFIYDTQVTSLSTALDLFRTVTLLAVGFIFGNQNKRD